MKQMKIFFFEYYVKKLNQKLFIIASKYLSDYN